MTRLTVVPLRSSPSQGNAKAALYSSCKNESFLGLCLLTIAQYRWKSPRIRTRRLKLSILCTCFPPKLHGGRRRIYASDTSKQQVARLMQRATEVLYL